MADADTVYSFKRSLENQRRENYNLINGEKQDIKVIEILCKLFQKLFINTHNIFKRKMPLFKEFV